MRTLLHHYNVLCLCAALVAPAVVVLHGPARADSMSSYSDGSSAAQNRENREKASYLSKANSHSLAYLAQAREFREAGRYELARQRYLQALSICADEQTVYIIKRELSGVELLLRTMR